MTNPKPPRWDLTNVYPGLESDEFNADMQALKEKIVEMEKQMKEKLFILDASTPVTEIARGLNPIVDGINEILQFSGTLGPYLFAFISTDSYDKLATRKQSEYDQVDVLLQQMFVRFQTWIGKIQPVLENVLKIPGSAHEHAFILTEIAEQSRYLMTEAEEILASELNLSGATGWNKLHGVVTSQLSAEVEVDGKVQQLPMPAVINLRSHPDEPTRRRGFEAELQTWPKVQESLAACLNGVKGTVNTLNKHRGRKDAVHSSLDQARIDRDTLEAMLDAMKSAHPTMRRYFHAKAKHIGKEKLAWWDLFAPVGKLSSHYTFEKAREFILAQFEGFSPELSAFASNAFQKKWIDAEQRDGKQGGAYCMGIARVKESRIFCNFDGSMDQVSTLAHELGHGFHDYCANQFNKTQLQQRTPMTLAETASIMCETVITNALLKEAKDPQEILFILEQALINDASLVVDIYSRYLFEKEVFERREKSELSAEELNDIMIRAQKATYGDGLDERYLQPYMWAWKPHYYDANLSFYNYPYTFGLLFGTGLYAVFQERGQEFIPEYKELLASTGEGSAADLAARFGLNIRRKEFWENSLKVVSDRIEQYIKI